MKSLFKTQLFILVLVLACLMPVVSAEYSIRITSDSISEVALEINDVVATDEGGGFFRLTSTNPDYQIARAKIMQTLFYGTNGADPRVLNITNPTKLVSYDIMEVGKRAHYGRAITNANTNPKSITATFNNTLTNYNISSWSFLNKISSGTGTLSYTANSGSSTFDQISGAGSLSSFRLGTDTSANDSSNLINLVYAYSHSSGPTNTETMKGIILAKGNATWTESAYVTTEFTDFFINHSIPIFSTIITNLSSNESTIIIRDLPIDLNFSLTDEIGLVNSTLLIDGVVNETINISGNVNSSLFTRSFGSSGEKIISILVCDVNSNCFSSDNYTLEVNGIIENSLSFSTPVLESSVQTFVLNSTVGSGFTISSANFNYNGTLYTPSIALSGDSALLTATISVPAFSSDQNQSFFFNITLSDNSENILGNDTQLVQNIEIDNCGVFTDVLFNMSLFDERTLEDINGTIELEMEILNPDFSLVDSVFANASNIHNASFCANINLTTSDNLYNLELRYYSSDDGGQTYNYVPEFYHIQGAATVNLPQSINLYDLNVNESQEFVLTYRDNSYSARAGVLLTIMRKYVSEGLFRTVEIPITSVGGEAIGHFDLDNYKYKIVASEDGVILNTFDNPAIVCDSPLSSVCSVILNGQGSPNAFKEVTVVDDLSYDIVISGENITLSFIIPSGESKTIGVSMIQHSPLTDPVTLCNTSLLSSSGSFECSVNPTIGDSQVVIVLTIDGEVKGKSQVYYEEDLSSSFVGNNYFIAALLLIALVSLFVSSPPMMVASTVFGVLILGLLFLLKGTSIGTVLGAITWIIVVAIIILVKINKKDES